MSWDPRPGAKGPAGGDLAGTYPDPSVAKVPAAAIFVKGGIRSVTSAGLAVLSLDVPVVGASTGSAGKALGPAAITVVSITLPLGLHLVVWSVQKRITAALTGGQVTVQYYNADTVLTTVTTAATAIGTYWTSSTTTAERLLVRTGPLKITASAITAGAGLIRATLVALD